MSNTKKWISLVLIALGVGLLTYPIIANILAERERSVATTTYNTELDSMSDEEKSNTLALIHQYNEDMYLKQKGELESQNIDYKNQLTDDVLGTLEIPSLNIKGLPYYHGTSYETLNKGLGHYEPSSIPVGGINTRSVITGHSGMQNQVLFSNIMKLEEGDIFYIHVLDETLAYEIRTIEEVLPTETQRINIVENEDIVTLLTCTPPGINTYRLLVNGYRIPYKEAKVKTVTKRDTWSYQRLVLITLGSTFTLSLILYVLYRVFKKQLESEDKTQQERGYKKLSRLLKTIKVSFIMLIIFMIGTLILAIYGYINTVNLNTEPTINIGKNSELYQNNPEKIQDANYMNTQIRSVNAEQYVAAQINKPSTINQSGVGQMTISSLNINLPILAGLSNDNLLVGAGTYSESQQMGKGNYVLMSHNLVGGKDALLNGINNVGTNDLITITDYKYEYTYEVYRNEIIEDTATGVLQPTDEAIITLLRCEGDVGTPLRQIVQGKYIKKEPLSDITTYTFERTDDQVGVDTNGIANHVNEVAMSFSSNIISNPFEIAVPYVLLFIFPIIIIQRMTQTEDHFLRYRKK